MEVDHRWFISRVRFFYAKTTHVSAQVYWLRNPSWRPAKKRFWENEWGLAKSDDRFVLSKANKHLCRNIPHFFARCLHVLGHRVFNSETLTLHIENSEPFCGSDSSARNSQLKLRHGFSTFLKSAWVGVTGRTPHVRQSHRENSKNHHWLTFSREKNLNIFWVLLSLLRIFLECWSRTESVLRRPIRLSRAHCTNTWYSEPALPSTCLCARRKCIYDSVRRQWACKSITFTTIPQWH